MPGEGDEVEVPRVARRPHVDAVMGRELGGVDGDPGAVAVRELGDLVQRGHETGDVGRAAQGDQADLALALFQRVLDGVEVDVAAVRQPDHDVPAAVPPREKVGVVLHLRDQHLPAVEASLLGRDPVQGVGRALDEDHDLVRFVDGEEARHQLARVLVCLGREARLVAGATVHARVQVREPVHDVADPGQRRCAGGVVEVDAGDRGAAE